MNERTKNDVTMRLLSPADILAPGAWNTIDPEVLPYYLLTLWWTESFLVRSNRDLGRAGPVCPFVRPSLDRSTFWLTSVKTTQLDVLAAAMMFYRDWFMELEPTTGEQSVYKTILVLLPRVQPDSYHALLDDLQAQLKPDFIRQELMIGQFYPGCDEPGVRNSSFRPLRSPCPLMAIRKITSGDIVFMKEHDGRYNPEYLQHYLMAFAGDLPKAFMHELTTALSQMPGATADETD